MRVHLIVMTLILLAAILFGVTTYELLHLMSAFALVLITEMLNTSIERVIDLSTPVFDERARIAKDVAAGAVMIATAYAVAVGTIGIATSETFWRAIHRIPAGEIRPHLGIIQGIFIGSILLAVFISWLKMRTGRGTFWRGGIASGHTALAFLVATSLVIMTQSAAIACLALALALLVSQSRVQANIHSLGEVILGALLGTVMAVIIFLPFGGYG